MNVRENIQQNHDNEFLRLPNKLQMRITCNKRIRDHNFWCVAQPYCVWRIRAQTSKMYKHTIIDITSSCHCTLTGRFLIEHSVQPYKGFVYPLGLSILLSKMKIVYGLVSYRHQKAQFSNLKVLRVCLFVQNAPTSNIRSNVKKKKLP